MFNRKKKLTATQGNVTFVIDENMNLKNIDALMNIEITKYNAVWVEVDNQSVSAPASAKIKEFIPFKEIKFNEITIRLE